MNSITNNNNHNTNTLARGRGHKSTIPLVTVHAKLYIGQYNGLKEEAAKRGLLRGKASGQFVCEIIREAVDYYLSHINGLPNYTEEVENV
jgi:hypothetical protein